MAYRVKAYTLREESTESGTRYFISFKDGQGKSHELEVSEQFFMEFRQMERRNRNLLQWDERHREFSEVWDETLNRRALKLPKSIEEQMIEAERAELLCKAVDGLPEIQRRRFLLYYEYEFNFYQSFIVQYRITKLLKSTLFVKLPAIRFHILTSFLVGKLVVLPPFSRGNTAFFKNAEDFLKFLQKFFERTKCARPKSPDGRIGIVSSIQMIRQFIYISVVSPGGGRAFFDKSITVGFCRYAFCFMAATSFSRRFQQ